MDKVATVQEVQALWKTLHHEWAQFCISKQAYEKGLYDSLPDTIGRQPSAFSKKDAPKSHIPLLCAVQCNRCALFCENTTCDTVPRNGDILVGFISSSAAQFDLTAGENVLNHLILHPNQPTLALQKNCLPMLALQYVETKLQGSEIPAGMQTVYAHVPTMHRKPLAQTAWNVGDHCIRHGVAHFWDPSAFGLPNL